MSTIKNDQILRFCHFNKIMKEPRTSFQSPVFSQKQVRNICHTAYYNHGHNIMRIYDVLPKFPFTTSEAKPD